MAENGRSRATSYNKIFEQIKKANLTTGVVNCPASLFDCSVSATGGCGGGVEGCNL